MKVQALRFRIGTTEHCYVDTERPDRARERYQFMVKAFPENRPQLVVVDIPDVDHGADTLRPSAPDPFAPSELDKAVRAKMQTLDEATLESRDRRTNEAIVRGFAEGEPWATEPISTSKDGQP